MSQAHVPLIAHVIFRLHVGGLENGLVNLINGLPPERFRHVIICIDDFTDFKNRIRRSDVEIIAIHKKPGTDLSALWRLYKVFCRLRPDILHTRNLAALDALLPALLAGIPYRIHGEHGRDINDLDGTNKKLQLLRKLHRPLVHRYIALSKDLTQYLSDKINVPAGRISQIYNGVDTAIFRPINECSDRCGELDKRFGTNKVVIGTIGRLDSVKYQEGLVAAVSTLVEKRPDLKDKVRLAIIGDGPTKGAIEMQLVENKLDRISWSPGSRNDIPEILRSLDVFVLPSLAEGISNTILEAMATGLPVIATDVGGNRELIVPNETGQIVTAANPVEMCDAILSYVEDERLRLAHGGAGRNRLLELFGIDRMVEQYRSVYEQR